MSLREYAERQAETMEPESGIPFDDTEPGESRPKSTYERYQDIQKSEIERAITVYQTYQANIKKAESNIIVITKGLQGGENIAVLLLKALEVISLYTDNRLIYSTAETAIQAVYGIAFKERAAAAHTAAAVSERLDMLRKAEREAISEGYKSSIHTAIREHEKLLAMVKDPSR